MYFDISSLPCFSGDDNFKIENFLRTIQIASKLFQWSDLQTQAVTLLRLTGTAWQYMTLYEYPFCDWSEISKILLQRFSPTFPSFICHQILCECIQYRGESLLKFALRIQYFGEKYKMSLEDHDNLAVVAFTEQLKVWRFVNGLLSGKMRIALMRKDPSCLMEALDFAMEEEYWDNVINYCGDMYEEEIEFCELVNSNINGDDFADNCSEIADENLMCVDELDKELLVDDSKSMGCISDEIDEAMSDCEENNELDLCGISDVCKDYVHLNELKMDSYKAFGNANVLMFNEKEHVLNDENIIVGSGDNQSYVEFELDSARKTWKKSVGRYEDTVRTCGGNCEWRSIDLESVWVRDTARKRDMAMDTAPMLSIKDDSSTAVTKVEENYRVDLPVKNRGV